MDIVIKISEEEFRKRRRKYLDRALKLARRIPLGRTPPRIHMWTDYFSRIYLPLFYDVPTMKGFRFRKNVREAWHFIKCRCSSPQVQEAICTCLAIVEINGERKYFYSRHKVGNCPHKE